MIGTLPIEIILEIVSKLEHWKDILALRKTNRRIFNIINKRKKELFKERKISKYFVQYDLDNQISKRGEIMKISDNLPFDQLPWKYQTNEKCIAMIHKDYTNYDYVNDKTDEIRILAANYHAKRYNYKDKNFRKVIDLDFVQNFGHAFKYADNQTKEMCMIAINKYLGDLTVEIGPFYGNFNLSNLKYVKEKTYEICLAAVKRNGCALKYVEEQTYEMCLIAVKNNGLALRFVKKQTDELCVEAVKNDGLALIYVKNQTHEICLHAVNQNGNALYFVKKQTFKIVCVAMCRKGNNEYVHEEILINPLKYMCMCENNMMDYEYCE